MFGKENIFQSFLTFECFLSGLRAQVLVMYPSLGSARFGSVLARAFKEKARLGSARYVFEKARFLKNAQNEPKINYEAPCILFYLILEK